MEPVCPPPTHSFTQGCYFFFILAYIEFDNRSDIRLNNWSVAECPALDIRYAEHTNLISGNDVDCGPWQYFRNQNPVGEFGWLRKIILATKLILKFGRINHWSLYGLGRFKKSFP